MYDKSIIISYKESSDDRRDNLHTLLDYLSFLQDGKTEIIIVEQDDNSKLDWLSDVKGHQFIRHIFLENSGIFNKGWGYNVGAKQATTEILMFSDSDMFIKPQTYSSAIQNLKTHDVVNPYKSVIFLDEESSKLFKQNNYSVAVANKFTPVVHGVITGGVFFINRKKFIAIKGFDEDCYGYGHEDDILDEKIKKLGLKVITLNDTAIHIHHKGIDPDDAYYSFIDLNKQLFAEYSDMTKQELSNKIKSIKDDEWGALENPKRVASVRHIKRELYEQITDKVTSHILSKITDEYIDEMVNDISTKIYNAIVETVSDKVKEQLSDVSFTSQQKENMVRKIMRKFNL